MVETTFSSTKATADAPNEVPPHPTQHRVLLFQQRGSPQRRGAPSSSSVPSIFTSPGKCFPRPRLLRSALTLPHLRSTESFACRQMISLRNLPINVPVCMLQWVQGQRRLTMGLLIPGSFRGSWPHRKNV